MLPPVSTNPPAPAASTRPEPLTVSAPDPCSPTTIAPVEPVCASNPFDTVTVADDAAPVRARNIVPTADAVPPVCVHVDEPSSPIVRLPAADTSPPDSVMLPVLDGFHASVTSPDEDSRPPLTVTAPVLGPFLPA